MASKADQADRVKIRNVDHIGIAVRSLAERLPFWTEGLGLAVAGRERVPTEQVEVAFLSAGRTRLELLEPTDDTSPVARFIERRGEGVHHLTFEVVDLDRLLAALEAAGIEVIGEAPRTGAAGSRVAFLHPRSCGGILIELTEPVSAPVEASSGAGSIEAGAVVLAYLGSPQEKVWGVLRRLDPAGLVVEGVDLGSFDDWVLQIERGETSIIGPSVLFIPMARVEKLLLDRASGELPSMAAQFEARTGKSVHEALAEIDGAEA